MGFLDQVVRGKLETPHLILIHGVDGVGKTTFGADAPKPIFLGPERGTASIDVHRFPPAATENWSNVIEAVKELIANPKDYKTLVVDSLDWLEPLVWFEVATEKRKKSIEDIGFAKGYIYALDYWQNFKDALLALREKKGLNVILICHSEVKTFQDPSLQTGYDRYELKLHKKAAGLMREFVDTVLFANYETYAKDDGSRTRAFGDGSRVMYTERRPGFDAKNRCNLKPKLTFGWDHYIADYKRAMSHEEKPEDIKGKIMGFLENFEDQGLKDKVVQAVEAAGNNATLLNSYYLRLLAKSEESND